LREFGIPLVVDLLVMALRPAAGREAVRFRIDGRRDGQPWTRASSIVEQASFLYIAEAVVGDEGVALLVFERLRRRAKCGIATSDEGDDDAKDADG
jgi:hypothetical protein